MKRLSRIGGALYLVIIAVGLWGEMFVRDRLPTIADIHAHETLWRVHIAAEIVLLLCATALLMIFYVLFEPVNRNLTLMATFFNLVSISIEAVGALYLLAFDETMHSRTFGISLIFFGCFCIIIGYLIFTSGLIAKPIGVLMQIAGVCYMINSFALIVSPPLAHVLFPAILVPSFIAELSLALYMAIVGVRSSLLPGEKVP